MSEEKTAIHQWTNDAGEVMILRFVSQDGKSYGGFQNPMVVGEVLISPEQWDEAWGPKPREWRGGWIADRKCGGGIHGWPWGIGIGDGKEPDWQAVWQVYGVKPEDLVAEVGDGPKCKFREGTLRYSGDWHGAAMFIMPGQMAWTFHNSSGSASNSGDRGSASNSGDRGSASNSGSSGSASNSGDRGSASNSGSRGSASNSGDSGSASNSGDRGSASNSGDSGSASNSGDSGSASNSGYSGSASNSGSRGSASNSGDRGSASNSGSRGSASNSGSRGSASNSGDRGSAESTHPGTAAIVTGLEGRARAAEYGCIALAWFNPKAKRVEMRCAQIGAGKRREAGKLKPNVWYTLNKTGNFVEVK